MIISDLSYLEVVAEADNLEGGIADVFPFYSASTCQSAYSSTGPQFGLVNVAAPIAVNVSYDRQGDNIGGLVAV